MVLHNVVAPATSHGSGTLHLVMVTYGKINCENVLF